ncbi:MAG TPA: L,D-transpeptidase [Acidimicrobiia bacterium]|nr:L,D-transpeptidase [Acidimicrobiia bacterium]HIL45760.1 L,D-transpeptidase [Acidimicrobiia bacterium]
MKTRQTTALLLTITLALTACGGTPATEETGPKESPVTTEAPAPSTTEAPAPTPTEAPAPTTEAPAPSTTETPAPTPTEAPVEETAFVPDPIYVARAIGTVEAYANPSDTDPAWTFEDTTDYGSTTVFLVNTVEGDWYNVDLPVRPNETSGWVHASQIELRTVTLTIVIDQSERTLTVNDGPDVVLETSVAIGSEENPSPTGEFFLTDKLLTGNPSGAYGPVAFGLSAFSDTLSSFAGGPGQIGIHGTNQQDSIGTASSHGCIRTPNEVALLLNDLLPLGTPVTIQA